MNAPHCSLAVRVAALIFVLTPPVHGGIVDDVRYALAQNNFATADRQIHAYQAERGITPELAEAISWMGRAALDRGQLGEAEKYAREAKTLSLQQLKARPIDREPHLPLALGASIEVQAQVLAARRQRTQAVAMLEDALRTYQRSSIRARIQKNLNLLNLVGHAAPRLQQDQYLGIKPKNLTAIRPDPVLLFFWAHWCGDCKYEGKIITQLRSEYASKGLKVVAPTQLYGYAGQGQNATPAIELMWIEKVWQHFYPDLGDVAVPISKANFDTYGASTTPTLVVIDGKGIVELYHPGIMSYEDLRTSIESVLKAGS